MSGRTSENPHISHDSDDAVDFMLSSVVGECAPQRHLYRMLLIALPPAHSARHPAPTCLSAQYVRQVPRVMHGQREDGCRRQNEKELQLNTEVLAKICTSHFVLL